MPILSRHFELARGLGLLAQTNAGQRCAGRGFACDRLPYRSPRGMWRWIKLAEAPSRESRKTPSHASAGSLSRS